MRLEKFLLIEVRYRVRDGKREEFYQKILEAGIAEASGRESGNLKYEYAFPTDSENDICLTEIWLNKEAQEVHCDTLHYKRLMALKEEYVLATQIHKSAWKHTGNKVSVEKI